MIEVGTCFQSRLTGAQMRVGAIFADSVTLTVQPSNGEFSVSWHHLCDMILMGRWRLLELRAGLQSKCGAAVHGKRGHDETTIEAR